MILKITFLTRYIIECIYNRRDKMKKIILIAALFIGFLGINEVKAESRVRVVFEN